MVQARQLISDLIVGYRKMKNEGVVANYQKERFDQYSNFARIGNGSLGGKGRGLAFMGTMVKRYPKLEHANCTVNIPKTVVISTDVFDEFMESNNLYPLALKDAPDEEILAAFEAANLPSQLLDDLMALFEVVHGPIAVRSSSLLEDSHYQPFAGVYKTYMIPKVSEKKEMLRLLRSAIKAVYASVFYSDSKAYLTATQNLIDQEKMAIVLQEVVGSVHVTPEGKELFYPTLSGVARSLNFYPLDDEQPTDGTCNLAFGLGKYIVDGGQALRFSPCHPHHILQLSTTDMALRETQRHFYALDLTNTVENFQVDDAFNLQKVPFSNAPVIDDTMRYVASTFDPYDQAIRDGYYSTGRPLVTFAGILQHDAFPLAETVNRLLRIGKAEMGRPVEIEFAMDINNHHANFYLLQIRPIVDSKASVTLDLTAINPADALITTPHALGNGIISDVSDIIYVKTTDYNPANNPIIAREVEKLNKKMLETESGYLLIGPGRWGSSDPWLGIPVKWPHISAARLIVESGLSHYRVDPSQGTHFFQNLTSFGVGYFTINPYINDGTLDEAWLDDLPAVYETEYLRHVRTPHPLNIQMDGRHSMGVVLKR